MNLPVLKSAMFAVLGMTASAFAAEPAAPHPDAADLAHPPVSIASASDVTAAEGNLLALPDDPDVQASIRAELVEAPQSDVTTQAEPPMGIHAAPPVEVPQSPVVVAAPQLPATVIPVVAERAPMLELTPTEKAFASTEARLLQQIRLLDLQLEVRERQNKLHRGPESSSPSVISSPVAVAPEPSAAPVAMEVAPVAPVPRAPAHPFRLVSIWGADGDLRAEFMTATAKRIVVPGGHIHGGWMLDAIRQGEVVVSNGKRRSTLKLGI